MGRFLAGLSGVELQDSIYMVELEELQLNVSAFVIDFAVEVVGCPKRGMGHMHTASSCQRQMKVRVEKH